MKKVRVTYFPVYNIHSQLVKDALGMVDTRTIESFLKNSGITIHELGGKKLIKCEDVFRALELAGEKGVNYVPISDNAKSLEDLK